MSENNEYVDHIASVASIARSTAERLREMSDDGLREMISGVVRHQDVEWYEPLLREADRRGWSDPDGQGLLGEYLAGLVGLKVTTQRTT
jgi:hypothetical protein